MADEIISVSLPVRFLSMGQGAVSDWLAAPVSVRNSFLLAVRKAGSGTEEDRMPSRQVFLFSPGTPVPSGLDTGASAHWYWIRFRSAVSPDAAQVRLGPLPMLLSESAFSRFSFGFHQLLRESSDSRLSDLCDYMLSVLLLALQDDSRRTYGNAVANSLLEYIRLHCCEPLTLPDIARALGYSEDYLSRLLHRHVSCSFRQYVHRLRMQRAKTELLSGFKSIREIAEDCGYGNAKFFSTSFQKYEGLTPSAFRNLYASGCRQEDTAN